MLFLWPKSPQGRIEFKKNKDHLLFFVEFLFNSWDVDIAHRGNVIIPCSLLLNYTNLEVH